MRTREHVLACLGVVLILLVSATLCPSKAYSVDSSEKPETHVGKGYDYVQDARYAEAAREFEAALTADPHLVRARYQLAVCYFALGRRSEARQQFQRVRAETGDDPKVIYYLGRLDLLEGDFGSSIRWLRSISANPPFPDTDYYLGSAYLKKNELDEAEKWLRRAAEVDPRDFRVPDHLARIYYLRGRSAQAEKEYARSANLRERYNESTHQAVDCSRALETNALREARPVCQRLFDAADPDKLVTLGMLYGQHGDYADAVRPLVRAAQLDSESSEIQHNLGLTYFRLKQYAQARGPLERAVSLRPDFFGSSALLGATLYALKEDEAAYRTLNHAHQLNPQNADTATLLFNTAVLLSHKQLASKAYADCLHSLRTAAELRPGDAEVHRELARVYSFLGQKAQAETENQAAKSLSDQ